MARDVLSAKDSNLKGYWLLTELVAEEFEKCMNIILNRIDHWDFEQERLVLLSDNSVIVCTFNFRFKYLKEWKIIPLQLISAIQYGNPIYPSTALLW